MSLEVAPPDGQEAPLEAPVFARRLNDQAAKVGTRVRFLVELRQPHGVEVCKCL